jgi:hypothetical protein
VSCPCYLFLGWILTTKIPISAAYKIIAVLTTAQYETDNIGSACANASFYTQFNGKTEADYSDIEAISGATITTNGYKTAIGKVFEAVKIMEGVA